MATTAQDTIERFQQLDLTTEEVRTAIDLPRKATKLFVILLDYIIEGTLEIKDLGNVMRKFKFGSPYAQVLKKAGLITNGEKRGMWLFTEEAVERMRAIVDGEPVAKKAGTARKKPGPKAKKDRPAKVVRPTPAPQPSLAFTPPVPVKDVDISRMTFGEIKARLSQLKEMVDAYTDEGVEMERQLDEHFGNYRKPAAAKKTAKK